MRWRYSDGGRAAAGYKGHPGDCVTRALAIATGLPYKLVRHDLNRRVHALGLTDRYGVETGLPPIVYAPYLIAQGFVFYRFRTTLKGGRLPRKGRLVLYMYKHLTAVIDGVNYDTRDHSLNGIGRVYGYFKRSPELAAILAKRKRA